MALPNDPSLEENGEALSKSLRIDMIDDQLILFIKKIKNQLLRQELLLHQELRRELTVVALNAGNVLFEQGESVHFCFLVLEGSVKLSRKRFKADTTLTILSEGEMGGVVLMSRFHSTAYPASVIALTETLILKVPTEVYFNHWLSNKVIADYMSQGVQQRMNYLQEDKELQLTDVGTRLVHFLVRHYIEKKDLIGKPITRKQIAQAIGSKTETVIRMIKKLEINGIIETHKSCIRVLDPHKLRNQLGFEV